MDTITFNADCLFHFTKEKEHFLSILNSGFKPSYCPENWDFYVGIDYYVAIPMVSFCDIPLSKTHIHSKQYGDYAIGLDKNWGKHNSITPLSYLYYNSKISTALKLLFKNLDDSTNLAEIYKHNNRVGINNILKFCKSLKGIPFKNIIKNEMGELNDFEEEHFSNEQEWRWVPVTMPIIHKNDKETNKQFDEYIKTKNKKFSQNLTFRSDDIKYIIISKEPEREEIIKAIRHLAYSEEEYHILISKIISMQQIKEDF